MTVVTRMAAVGSRAPVLSRDSTCEPGSAPSLA